jgi:hypothetical protein
VQSCGARRLRRDVPDAGHHLRGAETADWIGDFAAERTAYVLKTEVPDAFAGARAGAA